MLRVAPGLVSAGHRYDEWGGGSSTDLQLETPTTKGSVRAAHPKLERQTLGDEEFGVQHVGRGELRELGDEVLHRDDVVRRLRREEEAGRPGRRLARAMLDAGGGRCGHDGLRVPLHQAVLEVETLEVADGRRFDDLGQPEPMSADLGHLLGVEPQQEELVVDGQVGRLRRGVGERMSELDLGFLRRAMSARCFGGARVERATFSKR